MRNLIQRVKEIKEIHFEKAEDCNGINLLLKENWIVIQIVPYAEGVLFVLGRL